MTHDNNCIFCKIVRGQIPVAKVYEDDRILAFLNHQPVRPGATLVIPKEHIPYFVDLPDDLAAHIVATGNKIARRIDAALKPARVGFMVVGFEVDHAHYHVVPMHETGDITSLTHVDVVDGQARLNPDRVAIASMDDRQKIADMIKI